MTFKRIGPILAIACLPLIVSAANVDITDNITITLPGDSTQYTLTSDSLFDSMSVNSLSIDFVMQGGQRVVLRSATKRSLGNTLNKNTTCITKV